MTLKYSAELVNNLRSNNIKPIFALELDGVPFTIGSDTLKKYARYGDEGLVYGQAGLVYGGLVDIDPSLQKTLISLDGLTSQIRQELQIDKAVTSSISQLSVKLADINGVATNLGTGQYGEIIYKNAKLWVGFSDQSDFNRDFILIFRGIVETCKIEQGYVSLLLSSPDQKKRQVLAPKADTELAAGISNSATVLSVDSNAFFFLPPAHPEYPSGDDTLKSYVVIDDEIIRYGNINGNNLESLTRGQLNTLAASHSINAQVESFFTLQGHPMDLALKIMLSDENRTNYLEDLEATSVVKVLNDTVANSIYFSGVDLVRDYNVQIGDWVITSGFTEAGNNFGTYKQILNLIVLESGSYIVVDNTMTREDDATGSVTFLSQFNTLGKFGLGYNPEEIDIERHLSIKNDFSNNVEFLIYFRDEVEDARELIELELYKPISCYGLPQDRRGLSRISVGIHLPPLPIDEIVTIDKTNVINPENVAVTRSLNKYHYNVIGYAFEDSPLDEEFSRKRFVVPGTVSIQSGNKTLKIESKGFRDSLGAVTTIDSFSARLLDRYKGAAEYIKDMRVKFGVGSRVNIGDIVLFDPTDLNIPNFETFGRGRESLLMECVNKVTDIKQGTTKLTLLNTNFGINSRYALIGPTSRVTKTISGTKYLVDHWIDNSFSGFGLNEGFKWTAAIGSEIEIYDKDDETINHYANLVDVTGNVLTIDSAPGFTVTAEQFYIRLGRYTNATDNIKLLYVHVSDGDLDFADGGKAYEIYG